MAIRRIRSGITQLRSRLQLLALAFVSTFIAEKILRRLCPFLHPTKVEARRGMWRFSNLILSIQVGSEGGESYTISAFIPSRSRWIFSKSISKFN
ncbi:hypothetical protein CDL12_29654 [Handroanthus impetiginosus]|uniref:Uncharacterized protein n=1 Tax=Handroanthus impetiginosus TaxID=429701 RepID=A0A2G9FYA9_9LAMI|nr:hypothetical protein CDL12_29654 [Handroanthus impetiginosus]